MKLFFAFLLLSFVPVAMAKDAAPIEITADTALEWDRDASTFIARGNATATQGKTSITSEKLTADYTEKGEGLTIKKIVAKGGNPIVKTENETLKATIITAYFSNGGKTELEKIIAEKNVTIETKTQTLTGDHAEYYPAKQKATVTGNVKIIDGKNILTGDRADFDMKTNTSTLKSGQSSGRVRAVFFSGGDTQ
ncbi:MAG: hypothetical protein COB76_05005 [Alphaproteobacteria bacterium]|nr:MAG: hypothetical protein COB76_05005 [Alphaproteobacteria bacterium]